MLMVKVFVCWRKFVSPDLLVVVHRRDLALADLYTDTERSSIEVGFAA